ncbi:hypothetical protein ACP4OV_029810 [Aristida adscensionis]
MLRLRVPLHGSGHHQPQPTMHRRHRRSSTEHVTKHGGAGAVKDDHAVLKESSKVAGGHARKSNRCAHQKLRANDDDDDGPFGGFSTI